jgi:hypothetical protein
MRLLRANLSAHGQDIAARNSNDSLICFICFNGAVFAHSRKTPSTGGDPLAGTDLVCNLSDDAGDPIAASDPVCTSPDADAKEGSDEFLPDDGVDHGLDDRVDHGLDNMDLVRLPKIPSFTECEEEFRKQFYSNVDKRLMETRNKIPNYRPLFKTKQEALEIIVLLTAWDETGKGKRKRVQHTRHEYRIRNKYEIVKGK